MALRIRHDYQHINVRIAVRAAIGMRSKEDDLLWPESACNRIAIPFDLAGCYHVFHSAFRIRRVQPKLVVHRPAGSEKNQNVKKVLEPGPVSVKRPASDSMIWSFSGASDQKALDPLGSSSARRLIDPGGAVYPPAAGKLCRREPWMKRRLSL